MITVCCNNWWCECVHSKEGDCSSIRVSVEDHHFQTLRVLLVNTHIKRKLLGK
jgi:hypothetical protein